MRIGYPCTNLTIGAMMDLFPLQGEVDAAVIGNLACLARTLEFNEKADLFFFAIDPRLVPDQTIPLYAEELAAIGAYVKEKEMRIIACPAGSSLAHLAAFLDAMGLDTTAKIPVPGMPGGYDDLPDTVIRRLVLRNDRFHTVEDCCAVGRAHGVPVAYDRRAGGDLGRDLVQCAGTWKKSDGVPIVFYGSPDTPTIDQAAFRSFLAATAGTDIDIMLLFRDRERSAIMARQLARNDPRLVVGRQRVMSTPAHPAP